MGTGNVSQVGRYVAPRNAEDVIGMDDFENASYKLPTHKRTLIIDDANIEAGTYTIDLGSPGEVRDGPVYIYNRNEGSAGTVQVKLTATTNQTIAEGAALICHSNGYFWLLSVATIAH